MQLIWATEDLIIKGQPYPGFPIILHDDMESCIPANSFIRHWLFRGAIGSKQSWLSTGRAMYDYFSFLQAHELRWNDVQRGEEVSLVAAYRDYCLDTVHLARDTVRQRLVYVCELYNYALKQKWIDSLPFGYEDRIVKRDHGFLAHADASGGKTTARDVMPKRHKMLPKFLSMDQVKALLGSVENPHHRMLIRFALHTGLRRMEIATFPLAYVFDPDRRVLSGRNVRIRLNPSDGHGIKTKGSKARDIYISRAFLKELHHYVIHQRGDRAQLNDASHKAVFLNQDGAPYAADGKPISRIVREVGQLVRLKVSTHMLRHTYATHTLHAMQRSKTTIEPLVFVQRQLGHSSIETTMIYLHLINALADDAVLAYDDELNAMAKDS